MMRFRAGNRHGRRLDPGSYSETISPRSRDPRRELAVGGRVVPIDPAPEHGHRLPAGVERAAVGLAVDPARKPADDDEPGRGELAPERTRNGAPVRGAGARTDDGDRRPREQLRSAAPRTHSTGGGSWIAASSGG